MKHLINILKKSDPKDVVVIGDLMLDEYVVGKVERISPEAPVPVFKEERREYSFGGATNVATNCKHVGCNVHMIGIIGDSDQVGKKLLSMLTEKKVFVQGIVKSPDRITTRKKRIVCQQQQLLRVDSEETKSATTYEKDKLICNIHTVIKPGSIVLISDYSKGVVDREIVEEVIARSKVCGSLIVVDPKGPDFGKYKGVNYLKPNLKEFGQIVDYFGLNRDESIVYNARKVCKELSLEGLIITMGEKGMQFVSSEKDFVLPAYKKEVFDITGAGDTVLAFLAVGFANGFSLEQSMKVANRAASIAVSHHKTYAVSIDELMDDGVESNEKVHLDWKSLREEVNWMRRNKRKKIVFTNGCFDLLHSGHVYLLQEAKKMGDVLVVALNTDDSIKRLKGDSRPIKSFEERAGIISAMDVVDYVVPFDQDTPYKLIDYIRPDILVKGGDYRVESIIGYDLITSYGGSVRVVEYKDGLSTTNIVKSVKEIQI